MPRYTEPETLEDSVEEGFELFGKKRSSQMR
jgi:hypothetical protein